MTTVAIIIPYFQRKTGILRRALESVRQQQVAADVQVHLVIVDDSSPVPVAGEVAGVTLPANYRMTVIPQSNGGVGAARNTGLRQVSPATDYIGFLDSDDIWEPAYLRLAVAALDAGYECFFGDNLRLGEAESGFEQKNFARYLRSSHARLIGPDLYELDKDPFFDHSLRGRVFHISGLIFRRTVAPNLLFDTMLKYAGEDCLFLFQLLGQCERICCTPQRLVTCADGVNIYASRNGWDNIGHMTRNMCQLLSFYRWQQHLPLSPANRQFVQTRIDNFRKLFAFLTLRHFIKFRTRWPAELMEMVRADPGFYRWYPRDIIFVALGYGLRFYNPSKQW